MGVRGSLRGRPVRERAAERYACRLPGRLELCDSGVVYDGQLINLSIGGAMFRPALAYLLSRKSGDVVLRVGDLAVSGEIKGTTQLGYGLRFKTLLNDDALREVLDSEVRDAVPDGDAVPESEATESDLPDGALAVAPGGLRPAPRMNT